MKLGLRIVAALCVLIGFWTVVRTALTGVAPAVPSSSADGLRVWLFGIGGIALLLRKTWGWWFCMVGCVIMVIGGIAAYSTPGVLPLAAVMGMIVVVLFLNRPSTWISTDRSPTDGDVGMAEQPEGRTKECIPDGAMRSVSGQGDHADNTHPSSAR